MASALEQNFIAAVNAAETTCGPRNDECCCECVGYQR